MISNRLPLVAGLTAFLALTLAVHVFGIDAVSIVQKSEIAENNVNYKGLKYADISVGKSTIRAQFNIIHKRPNKTKISYIAPSELNGIVTIDTGSDSWRFIPAQRRWEHNKWELPSQKLSLALRNYRIVETGRGSVAGRQAYVIKLQPTKPGNPSETIWVDTKYFLVLKSELRNAYGESISTTAFKSIAFEPKNVTDAAFKVPSNVKAPNNPVPSLGFKIVKPKYVPRGYSFVQVSTVPVGGDVYAAHLMYTNGINTISIFERKKSRDSGDWKNDLGRWATVIRFDRGQITFTIIGDISKKELQNIGDSLK